MARGRCWATVSLSPSLSPLAVGTNHRTRYMNIFLSTWALTAAGMVFALPMVYYRVKDFTDIKDEALWVPLTLNSPQLMNVLLTNLF